MKRALVAAGADAATIAREMAKLPAETATPAVELDAADEGASATLFLALGTQWRTAGMAGVLTGLDYGAIAPTAALLGVEMTERRFLDLRTMEAAALKVMADARAAERRP